MTPALAQAEGAVRAPQPRRWTRKESVGHLANFEAAASLSTSQRAWAQEKKVPRSTLQHWIGQKSALPASAEEIAFFESPAGLDCLHRLVLALLLVFCELGPHGRRRVALALQHAGLSRFVAVSDGSLHKLGRSLEDQIIAYEDHHRPLLAAGMQPKRITVCQDETFHPQTCLVAMEAPSGFILLEKYAQNRDAATWTSELQRSLAGLSARVIQSTSDEAAALLAHVEKDLGAHHSPDIFHCQHELSQGISLALAAQVRHAEEAVAAQFALQEKLRENQREWHESAAAGGPAGPDFAACLAQADADHKSAEQALAAARDRKERAREAMRGIGDDYHPVDLQTGAPLEPAEVGRKLAQRLDEAEAVAKEAGLAERCLKAVAKARRLLPAFVRTLLFFSLEAASRIEGLALAPDQARAIDQYLLPLAYLECVVRKARDAAARQRLRDLIALLRACPPAVASSLAILSPERQTQVAKTVAECATIFQRASSCTEGRNGQLSLYHHGLHHLSDRKLRVLTVLHNYFILRPDGSTAAERFFGQQPPDLFEWLLGRVATPARPARPRSAPTPPAA